MDIKISQLSNVSSSAFTDLFEISRNLGGGSFESYSIRYQELFRSIIGNRVITVDLCGTGDAITIEEGIDKAIVLAPSATNPVVIQVRPGIYTENPLTIPNYVAVVSTGDNNTTYIDAITTTSPIMTVGSYSTISGFYFRNANGIGGCAIKGGGTNCVIDSCASSNCETGFYAIAGVSSYMRCVNCAVINAPGQTCKYGFRADNGAVFTLEQCIANGVTSLSLITNGIYAEGDGSIINMPTFFAYYCINGVYVDNGAMIDSDSGYIQNCTNAMRIGSNGSNSKISSLGTSIKNSTTYDALIESGTGRINFTGLIDMTKRSIVSGAKFNTIACTEEDQPKEGVYLTGQTIIEERLDIGTPGSTDLGIDVGLDMGEGGSYTMDEQGNEIVEYWQYDDSAASGSKFTRYANNAGIQLTDEDDAIIVGSKFPFSTVKIDIDVAANVGSNSFVTEHWNGTTWTEDQVCAYEKYNLTHRGAVIFQNVETQYVEVGTAINNDWISDKNVIDEIPQWDNNIDMYALRFRNNGGSIVTGMEFDSGMVKGDDFQISSFKKAVAWGRFRQTDTMVKSITEMQPNAVNPPQNITVDISPNISNVMQANFTDGNVSAATFYQTIPDWADTSSGIVLNIAMYATNTNIGNINTIVRYLPVNAGFIFDGTATEYSASLIAATVGVANLLFATTYTFNISSFSPRESFTISIERDATDGNLLDTYVGDIVVTGVQMIWTRKVIG